MELPLSACLWSVPGSACDALRKLGRLGFQRVDVEPGSLETPNDRQALQELFIQVSCIALDHNLPRKLSLDSVSSEALKQTVSHLRRCLNNYGALGATVAYVKPCKRNRSLICFGQALAEVAQAASELGIKLCLEHFPGTALATANETLTFIESLGLKNLYLLLDIGHCIIVGDDAPTVIRKISTRLGYVQVNDNDGKNDLHWALLNGRLTERDLRHIFSALVDVGYDSAVSLELSSALPDPISALRDGKQLLTRIMAEL
jgi:sugar phosphate isomerase/epimerase